MLFTPGPRLGWVFRDRRELVSPYREPLPDPQAITGQLADRHFRAERAWRRSRRWVARPFLLLAFVLYVAGVVVRDADHHAHTARLTVLTVLLATAGVGWPIWSYLRLSLAREADPARAYQAAQEQWGARADEHEHAQLARLDGTPEWASARSPAQRTDIYGGTLGGWQALLAVHGASILAGQPLLIADFSGQLASSELTALAQRHAVPAAVHLLPAALDASGILSGLSPAQFANALAEAIHAGTPGGAGRAERAVDLRVMEYLTGALGASMTPARLAAAVQAALGQPVPPGLLTPGETEIIGADLFPAAYRAQIAPSLVRLGNHHEAEQAATFIGRQHTFTVSGWTVTHDGEHSTSRTAGYSHGMSQTRGWSGDGLFPTSAFGAQTRSRDHGRNQEWSQSDTESDGESWSDARNTQRVYEYAVEPAVLQNLPGNALLLPAHGTAHRDVLTVECDPQIITLPGASADLAGPDAPGTVSPAASFPAAGAGGWLELAPAHQQPTWPRQPR